MGINNQSDNIIRFRIWVFVAIGFFAAGIAAGIAFSLTIPDDTVAFFSDELAYFSDLGDILEPSQISTFFFILINNIYALLYTFIFSPLLCLLPVFSLLLNGSIISLVGVLVAQERSVGFVVAGLLPHGIIEVPAFLLGEAAALGFGFAVMAALFSAKRRPQLLPTFRHNIRYVIIAIIMMVPAAIIETWITPLLLS